ncbi:MAG: hypothetical protein IKD76_03335 [Clostridia bacterium]|nr:hypothetical protein [Clostridia bacterium]
MDKTQILEKYKKEDERLLVCKLFDKILLADKQNKVQITDFLTPVELQLLKDVLKMLDCKNYSIYGGLEDANRNIIVIFPDKLEYVFKENAFDYNSICNCVRITNSSENYDHKVYLGGLIKLGIKREKIGDIVVYNNGADVVVSKDVSKFILSNLCQLTRFCKSTVEIVKLEEIVKKVQEFKEVKIVVSSMRLDNVVSELAKTSRSKALDILKQERVFINYKSEIKATKMVNMADVITIRGVGKFIVETIANNMKSGKYVVMVKKFM